MHPQTVCKTRALVPVAVPAQAGAKIQLVWDYKQSSFTYFTLTPWNIPDQKYIDTVVELAQKDDLFFLTYSPRQQRIG